MIVSGPFPLKFMADALVVADRVGEGGPRGVGILFVFNERDRIERGRGIAPHGSEAGSDGDRDNRKQTGHRIYPLTSPMSRIFRRVLSTAQSEGAYPFARSAIIPPPPDAPATLLPTILQGKNLMQHLHKTLPNPPAQRLISTLFSANHPDRLLPGSIISLTLAHAPSTFAGVLISVRHSGPDTSFTLRNVIQRTGVEMRFNAGSPHIKEVNVIQRASTKAGKEGRRTRRAKLFYLRDQPAKMSAVSASATKGL